MMRRWMPSWTPCPKMNLIQFRLRGGPFFGLEKCLKEFILTWWARFRNPNLVHSIFHLKFMITCPNPIVLHFRFEVRIWTKIGNSNYWKVDQNRIWTCDHKFRKKCVDQNRIFESSTSCENELFQTIFWTKKPPVFYFSDVSNRKWIKLAFQSRNASQVYQNGSKIAFDSWVIWR